MTRWLTENIVAWASTQVPPGQQPWRAYRELSIPVSPAGGAHYGRLDVTVMRSGAPDLAIEIDSAHNNGSAQKLTYARAAGAVPIWVRWHLGRVVAPEGTEVIDLVTATRGLARST